LRRKGDFVWSVASIMALPLMEDSGQRSAIAKRRQQLERWDGSETNKEHSTLRRIPSRVKFPEDCVFLAACSQGDKSEVKRLLDLGANINTGNVDGLTALHQVRACPYSNFSIFRIILRLIWYITTLHDLALWQNVAGFFGLSAPIFLQLPRFKMAALGRLGSRSAWSASGFTLSDSLCTYLIRNTCFISSQRCFLSKDLM
jgi:protein phosphatase 1 regulatory subunit 12A